MNEAMLAEIRSQPAMLEQSLIDLRGQVQKIGVGKPFRRVLLTGSGDSVIAALALETLFRANLDAEIRVVSSLQASRYEALDTETLVVAISVSGGVARTIEAVLRARDAGAQTVAVVARDGSQLGEAAHEQLRMASPMTRTTPHSRDYTATLLALAVLLERLTPRTFTELERWPELTDNTLDRAFVEMPSWADESPQTIFLGAGPDAATARYAALKFWEGGSMRAIWDDLEEFAHGSQLMTAPGHTVVMLATGPGAGRALEFRPGMQALGLRVRLVTDRSTIVGPDSFQTPDLGGTAWSPLVMCLPVQVFTYLTVQRRGIDLSLAMGGAEYGERFQEMHVEWTKRSALDPDGTLY
ncbi:MAG: SIS domain-containing protein [Candidatus Limnocylindrales bacterium]